MSAWNGTIAEKRRLQKVTAISHGNLDNTDLLSRLRGSSPYTLQCVHAQWSWPFWLGAPCIINPIPELQFLE